MTNEQRERILASYRQCIYSYKRVARELGLTRDQVQQVIVTTANQRRRKQMTSFESNDYRVKKANSAYWDNACIESFFGHLKAELGITHQKKVLNHSEMEQKIKDYIEYYRTKRIQARLAYRTPQEVLLEYQAAPM